MIGGGAQVFYGTELEQSMYFTDYALHRPPVQQDLRFSPLLLIINLTSILSRRVVQASQQSPRHLTSKHELCIGARASNHHASKLLLSADAF